MDISTVKTFIKKFNYEQLEKDEKDKALVQNKFTTNFKMALFKEQPKDIDENKREIMIDGDFTFNSQYFKINSTVSGIFIVPKIYADAIGNTGKQPMRNAISKAAFNSMASQFELYVALFSKEILTSPIILQLNLNE